MLIVLTISALTLGYVTNRLRLTSNEQTAIEKLRDIGAEVNSIPVHDFDENGAVKLDFESSLRGGPIETADPPVTADPPMPKFLWPVLGKEGFSRVGRLIVKGEEDADLILPSKRLGVFSEARQLFFENLKNESLDFLSGLPNVTELHLTGCNIITLDGIEKCKSLEAVIIENCNQLMNIDALAKLPNLKSLYFHSDSRKQIGPDQLSQLEQLEFISVSELEGFTDFGQLAELKNLKGLKVSGRELTDLSSLAKLPPLKLLHINNCFKIRNFDGLWSQMQLQELSLKVCYILWNPDGSSKLNLESLRDTLSLHVNHPSDKSFNSMEALKEVFEKSEEFKPK